MEYRRSPEYPSRVVLMLRQQTEHETTLRTMTMCG
jgi:hypothetical protein